MPVREPQTRRWSLEEYYEMGRLGWFEGQRVELIDGEIIEMSPHGVGHAQVIGLVHQQLQNTFGPKYWVRSQLPIRVADSTEPEPDVSVVKGSPRDFSAHPSSAELVVEVGDRTLAFDLGKKAGIYAAAGIQDYWVVDLISKQLHIHRHPARDANASTGWRYDDVQSFDPNDTVSPLALPTSQIKVADLLP